MTTLINYYQPKPHIDYLPIGKGIKEYILLKDYTVEWIRGDVKFRIRVPANLNTDFGTTPGGIFNEPEFIGGYIIHDWLYYQNTNAPPFVDGQEFEWYQYFNPQTKRWEKAIADWDRASADKLMLLVHKEGGVSWVKRSLVYRSVRLFGQAYWDS